MVGHEDQKVTPFGTPALCLYHACLDFFLNQQFTTWIRPDDDDLKRPARAERVLSILGDSGQRKVDNALDALRLRDVFDSAIRNDAIRLAHLRNLAHHSLPPFLAPFPHQSVLPDLANGLGLTVDASNPPNLLSHLEATEWARNVVIRFIDEYDRCRDKRKSTWDEWGVAKPLTT